MLCICMRKYIVPLLYISTYIVISFIWGSESVLMSSVSWFLCAVKVFQID